MENKKNNDFRFYIVLLIILSLSILVLGLSYSKESGTNYYEGASENINNLKIVYANSKKIQTPAVSLKNYMDATEYPFSVTNESKNDSYYELDIICDDCYGNGYYYSIDGILEEDLMPYGKEKDHVTHSLRVFNPNKAINNISYRIRKIKKDSFEYLINKDLNTVIDGDNYKFKEGTNNYVMKDGILYRVSEIKNDMVICNIVDEYLDVQEKVLTFNKTLGVLRGNGFVESPYEVNYESQ